MTFYDQLTSMPNKTIFIGFLKELLAQAKTVSRNMGLLLLDPDGTVLAIMERSMEAERIRKNLGAPLLLKEGAECSVGVSVGIAVYPDNGTELDRLLTVADSAMFESKTGGKNTRTAYKGLTHERADINRQDSGGCTTNWLRSPSCISILRRVL